MIKTNKSGLLAVTSYNQISYTEKCFKTLNSFDGDIVCIDDASQEPVKKLCDKYSINFIGRAKAKGLTYSWNLAYQMFMQGDYEYLIISNNDVLFPKGSLSSLAKTLRKYPYVGALTRINEPWTHARVQAVENYYKLPSSFVDNPANYERVQEKILSSPLEPIEVKVVYGFCFGVNRSIEQYQYSDKCLFNPKNINIGQERDLGSRVPIRMLCRSSFVYHYKSISFGKIDSSARERRNQLMLYHKKENWILRFYQNMKYYFYSIKKIINKIR